MVISLKSLKNNMFGPLLAVPLALTGLSTAMTTEAYADAATTTAKFTGSPIGALFGGGTAILPSFYDGASAAFQGKNGFDVFGHNVLSGAGYRDTSNYIAPEVQGKTHEQNRVDQQKAYENFVGGKGPRPSLETQDDPRDGIGAKIGGFFRSFTGGPVGFATGGTIGMIASNDHPFAKGWDTGAEGAGAFQGHSSARAEHAATITPAKSNVTPAATAKASAQQHRKFVIPAITFRGETFDLTGDPYARYAGNEKFAALMQYAESGTAKQVGPDGKLVPLQILAPAGKTSAAEAPKARTPAAKPTKAPRTEAKKDTPKTEATAPKKAETAAPKAETVVPKTAAPAPKAETPKVVTPAAKAAEQKPAAPVVMSPLPPLPQAGAPADKVQPVTGKNGRTIIGTGGDETAPQNVVPQEEAKPQAEVKPAETAPQDAVKQEETKPAAPAVVNKEPETKAAAPASNEPRTVADDIKDEFPEEKTPIADAFWLVGKILLGVGGTGAVGYAAYAAIRQSRRILAAKASKKIDFASLAKTVKSAAPVPPTVAERAAAKGQPETPPPANFEPEPVVPPTAAPIATVAPVEEPVVATVAQPEMTEEQKAEAERLALIAREYGHVGEQAANDKTAAAPIEEPVTAPLPNDGTVSIGATNVDPSGKITTTGMTFWPKSMGGFDQGVSISKVVPAGTIEATVATAEPAPVVVDTVATTVTPSEMTEAQQAEAESKNLIAREYGQSGERVVAEASVEPVQPTKRSSTVTGPKIKRSRATTNKTEPVQTAERTPKPSRPRTAEVTASSGASVYLKNQLRSVPA